MVPSDLRSRAARLCRLRHDPQLFFPAPAPPPLNRREHLDCRHRAMPIVTISIALGAHSAEKQGSHQRTFTSKTLGLTIPSGVLAIADEVIEQATVTLSQGDR